MDRMRVATALGVACLIGCWAGRRAPEEAAPPAGPPRESVLAFEQAPRASAAPPTSDALALLARPGVGINLSPVAPYGAQWAFADAFRASRLGRGEEWMLSGDGPPPELDEHGYPRGLAPGQRASTLCLNDLGGDYPGGEYTVSFAGTGALELGRDAARTRLEHDGRGVQRARVTVTPSRLGISVEIARSDPRDPVRDIRLVMPGCQPSAAHPFHPLLLERLRPFACLRFMDWGGTNGSSVVTWADRRRPEYRSQHRQVAYELMLQLANELRRPPWLCVPHRANADHVRRLARLVRARLDPALPVLVEYSNEVWNGQFRQHHDVSRAARGGGRSWQEEYARRALEAFAIFRAELGEGRVLRVIAAQAANPDVAARILSAVPRGGADALAIAPYFSAGREVNRDPAASAGWTSGDLLAACRADLERVRGMIARHRELAEGRGLALVAYEGGQHLVGRGRARDDADLTARFVAANRDPEMRALYRDYLALWAAEGGGLLCHFGSCERPGRHGSWGALEGLRQTAAPKYLALVEVARRWEREAQTPGAE